MIGDSITQDLKKALLARDGDTATVLRGIRSVILNAEIAAGKRDTGLPEEEIIALLQKEAKKRQESADMYAGAGEDARAEAELREKTIIEQYLPAQIGEEEVRAVVQSVVAGLEDRSPRAMGQVISAVKLHTKGAADGGVIARIAKEELQK
jgi:uncharacterized protein